MIFIKVTTIQAFFLSIEILTIYRNHNAPAFLGFENQDLSNIAYGDIHVPSIALKEIPVQREQLR